jgi:Ca2+-binding EF-hand superfamily protein
MMKTSAIVLICIFLISPVAFCQADENKDHVCFRVLDSDKDGVVTFQEFREFYDNAKEQFSQADVDKDGKLTHDEYHTILGHGSS